MTKRTRRNHSGSFKAKVALDALRGDKTLLEIAEKYQVHQTQVTEWKKQLLERAADVFDGGVTSGKQEAEASRSAHRATSTKCPDRPRRNAEFLGR